MSTHETMADKKKNEPNSSTSSSSSSSSSSISNQVNASGLIGSQPSLYENKTLMCKNNCGYYGNSIQYNGYCSICYRQLNPKSQQTKQNAFLMNSSSSFDDSSSLLSSSQLFSNEENKLNKQQSTTVAKSNQVWNELQNLSKFSAKQESKRRNSTFKLFRRSNNNSNTSSPANTDNTKTVAATSLNLVDTVSKAVNLVDQSLSNSSIINSTFLSLTSSPSNSFGFNDASFTSSELNNAVTRLVSSSLASSSPSDSNILFSNNNNNQKLSNNLTQSTALSYFEEKFRSIFPQLYQDLMKQLKQFVDKFLDAAYRRKDANSNLANNNTKQSEVIQDFYKKIYKYIQTSASIKSFLDKQHNATKDSLNGSFSESKSNSNINDNSINTGNNNGNESIGENLYEAIMIMVEAFINNTIYDYVFPSIMSEFEEQDMELQKRIRGFYWITNEMIGTCIDENSMFFRDTYEEALNYIVEMDSKRTSYEKMLCITECSKNIFKAINISAKVGRNISESSSSSLSIISPVETSVSEEQPHLINIISIESEQTANGDDKQVKTSRKNSTTKQSSRNKNGPNRTVASADDFLPAFIYIVLKANPTMLYSNINFVTRFAFEKRILQGEHAYHFCSLNAVIAHIENLNAVHLNMSQEEFENYSNGLVDIDSCSNVLKLVQFNLKMLSELKDKQTILRKETIKLQTDMSLFRELMQVKFNSCLNTNKEIYTQNIEGFVRKPNVLDDSQDLIKFNQITSNVQLLEPVKASVSSNSIKNNMNEPSNK